MKDPESDRLFTFRFKVLRSFDFLKASLIPSKTLPSISLNERSRCLILWNKIKCDKAGPSSFVNPA